MTATAIAIFEVDAADRDRVLTWQSGLDTAASARPGFVGTHFTRGFEEHDYWAAAVTFSSEATLRRWLDSAERAALLDQGAAFGARTGTTLRWPSPATWVGLSSPPPSPAARGSR